MGFWDFWDRNFGIEILYPKSRSNIANPEHFGILKFFGIGITSFYLKNDNKKKKKTCCNCTINPTNHQYSTMQQSPHFHQSNNINLIFTNQRNTINIQQSNNHLIKVPSTIQKSKYFSGTK